MKMTEYKKKLILIVNFENLTKKIKENFKTTVFLQL